MPMPTNPEIPGAPELCLPPALRKQCLNTREASTYLSEYLGTKMAVATLEKLRCTGGGPTFRKFGRAVVYERSELDRWVTRRMSGNLNNTADGERE